MAFSDSRDLLIFENKNFLFYFFIYLSFPPQVHYVTNQDIEDAEDCRSGGGGEEGGEGAGITIEIGPKRREDRSASIGGLQKISEGEAVWLIIYLKDWLQIS